MNKKRITNELRELGMAWAITSEKCVLPNDGYDARKTYHIHPEANYPHEMSIKRFDTLKEIELYIKAIKEAKSNPEMAFDIMSKFWASIT